MARFSFEPKEEAYKRVSIDMYEQEKKGILNPDEIRLSFRCLFTCCLLFLALARRSTKRTERKKIEEEEE